MSEARGPGRMLAILGCGCVGAIGLVIFAVIAIFVCLPMGMSAYVTNQLDDVRPYEGP